MNSQLYDNYARKIVTLLIAIAVPAAAVAAMARITLNARGGGQANTEFIDAPNSWVPFVADVTITHPGPAV